MEITYVSACFDSSGYAEAARNNIAAIHGSGVKIGVMPVSFEQQKTQQGKLGSLVQSLVTKSHVGKIQIVHLTPHHYPHLIRKDMYNIGYAAWETSQLPYDWVEKYNCLDEVWVPSEHNVQMCKDSGVTVPVFCIPHAFEEEETEDKTGVLENVKEDDFVFYSIFQWLERKNPIGLMRAFLTEFGPDEKVILVLKTFLVTPGVPVETERIRKVILDTKKTLYLSKYPRMVLISSLLSRDQMHALHARGDCYVSLHKCEGFGIPIAEAMMKEKPVIATSYGGPADFIKHEKTGFLVDYMLAPVSGMPWDIYKGYMNWAEPDLLQARQYMRRVFEDQKEAKKIGKAAKRWVKKNLSHEAVGQKMKARLEEISGR